MGPARRARVTSACLFAPPLAGPWRASSPLRRSTARRAARRWLRRASCSRARVVSACSRLAAPVRLCATRQLSR
jgi:hypothetical protein